MRGFVSYSHHDHKVLDELQKQLKVLCRLFPIEEFWVDDYTPAGRCFRADYLSEIERADIHVILISSDSLGSDEILGIEIPAIHARHAQTSCLVVPIIVDDCMWDCVTGTHTSLPKNAHNNLQPLKHKDWKKLKNSMNETGKQLRKAISAHFGIEPRQLFDWGPGKT